MPTYFEKFGPTPILSNHASQRIRERGVARTALWTALANEPRLGTTKGTVIYSAAGLEIVVDNATGLIVTLWWTE